MRFLKPVTDFFLFTSIYIAVCAVLMAWSTALIFHISTDIDLLGFIFTGTLSSYNFHWWLTPSLLAGKAKTEWSYRHRNLHLVILILSVAGAGYFAWQLIEQWWWLVVTAFITFLYSAPKVPLAPFRALKKIAVGKTVFLAFAWTHIPFILPLLLSGIEWTPVHYIFVFNRFYLIYAICILFDYRDRESDKKEGIRSMVTELPEAGVNRLFYGSMTVFFASTVLLFTSGFSLLTTILMALPGLVLLLLYRHSKKERSDYYYYFFLDGLMMLSGLLWLIFNKFDV